MLGHVAPRRLLVTVALVLAVSAMPKATSKGPDSAGYKATDETAFSFIDVAASGGASILVGSDDGTAALTLPFAFEFYGASYSMVCVSSNGAAYFVTNEPECSTISDFANTDLTSTAPPGDRPGLFPFWTDLAFEEAGTGVAYQTLGDAGSRRFVLQWNGAHPVGSPKPVAFEVILFEGSNQVLFQYKTVDLGAGDPATKGGLATIGVRNTNGQNDDKQVAWSHNAPVLANESAILFTGNLLAPTVTATGGTFPYNGSPRAGTGAAYGTGGVSLPVTLSYVGTGSTSYGPSTQAPTNAGTYNLTAAFGGNGSYSQASATDALTINRASQTAVTVTAPASVTFGTPATATATGGNAGTYSFSTGLSTGCSVAANQVSVTNATGTCALTATRAGDNNYLPSDPSSALTVTLVKAGQTITFTSTPPAAPAVGGPSYAVSATGGGSGNAVVFSSLTTGTCTVAGSTVSFVGVGPCQVAANQAGNNNYQDAAQATQNIPVGGNTAVATTTSITSNQNPREYAKDLTVTATIRRATNNTVVTSGTVTFKEGTTVLSGPVAVDALGRALFNTALLTAGNHTITAVYSGTASFAPSDASYVQVVSKAPTKTEVTSGSPSSKPNQNVTFTATVTSREIATTAGTVTFMDGTTAISGPIALSTAGTASFSTSSLSVGDHTIKAVYNGTANYETSSGTVKQKVK